MSWVRIPSTTPRKRETNCFSLFFSYKCSSGGWQGGSQWLSSQSMWAIIRILVYRYLLPLIFIRTFFFNLSILSFFEKRTKNFGTREKSSQAPFAHAAECEPSVGYLLVSQGYRLFSGCCGTWLVRLYKKSYTRTNLQTVLAQWPENKRPCAGFFNGAGVYWKLPLYVAKYRKGTCEDSLRKPSLWIFCTTESAYSKTTERI